MLPIERFVKACRNEEVDRPPVWMMRQAGRTLSEYRAVREKYSFWKVCKTPELATEVTMQPLRRFAVDAAVIFSDILTIPDAMGMEVQYTPKLTVSPALKDRSDINLLDLSGMTTKLQYVSEIIKSVRHEVSDQKAVLGFSGAPYTLACYMIQGEGSKDFIKVRQMMHHDPATFQCLMDILADAVSDYLLMQNDVSATAVQLFDTWAGELNPEDYKRFVLPYVAKIIQKVKSASDLPVIYYINNIGNLLNLAATSGADVMGVDWRITLAEVRERLGRETVVQGNLDPALLFAPEDVIKTRVNDIIEMTGGKGHIMNLGHGLNPATPVSGIEAFVNAVTGWKNDLTANA